MDASLEKRLKRQIIGKPHRFLAIAPLGFEQTLVTELRNFHIETTTPSPFDIVGDGKVEFTAKITEAWKAVAYSRIANRILMHVADFKAENFRELEKKAYEIPWELYLNAIPDHIHVTCKHSRLYHSDAIAERLQKVIEGTLSKNAPLITSPIKFHEQHLYVTFLDDRCTIWLDLAGEELYKRGHERFVNDAPLKETIAAGMIFESIHAQDDTSGTISEASYTLFDPMAGSGTFSLEVAYAANKLIPGICRDFALKHQPAFKEASWNYIVRREPKTIESTKIVTSDISERAIKIIKHNVECSPLADIVLNSDTTTVCPQLRDFFSYTAQEIVETCGGSAPIIVLNPPYGKRLDFDAPKLYTKIGCKLSELARALKSHNKSLTIAILAPKDDSREGSKYTCTANLLRECSSLSPENNSAAKQIVTSHGGFSLNVFIAKI